MSKIEIEFICEIYRKLILGTLIETVHGSLVTMALYFGGVIAGSMTGLLISPCKMTVGASGGDYALGSFD